MLRLGRFDGFPKYGGTGRGIWLEAIGFTASSSREYRTSAVLRGARRLDTMHEGALG